MLQKVQLKFLVGAATALLFLVAPLSADSETGPGTARPNVILISMDTVRPDHLSCYGYGRNTSPHIDKLAGEGVIFTQAFSQAPWTITSHLSIFYSLYPRPWWLNEEAFGPSPSAAHLAGTLQEHGYHTAFSIGLPEPLNPAPAHKSRRYMLMTEAFQAFQDRYYGTRLADLPRDLFAWIARHREEPFFIFLHGLDTHSPHILRLRQDPYLFNPKRLGQLPASRHDAQPLVERGQKSIEKAIKTYFDAHMDLDDNRYQLIAQYDAEIYYADRGLGELFAFLDNLKLLERTIIIVLSDHGEEFGERGKFGTHSGGQLHDELLRMVLVVRDPRYRPRTNKVNSVVQGVDVMPTILDLLDIPVPGTAEGRTLAPFIRSGRMAGHDEYALSFNPDIRRWSIRTKDWRLIHNLEGPHELYHLEKDPMAQHNVADLYPFVARQLMNQLESVYQAEVGEAQNADAKDWIQKHGYW